METPRFYCPDPSKGHLGETESLHALRVLRLRPGDRIEVFDGKGLSLLAEIAGTGKKTIHFSITRNLDSPSNSLQPSPRIVLLQPILKAKAMDWILQKATELGATRIIPMTTARTVVIPGLDRTENKTDKWNHALIEACKQCGQNHLPAISSPVPLKVAVTSQQAGKNLKIIAALNPSAVPIRQAMETLATLSGRADTVTLLAGPEGDFTPDEVDFALSNGFIPVSLGPLVLRAETAALALLAYTRLSCTENASS